MFSSFCVFCYQSIYTCAKATNSSESVTKFTKLIGRYTKNYRLDKLVAEKDKLKCCHECNIIIDQFCDYYHQLEVLELQMNWKLEQLAGIINHCNKVPSRWTKMNAALSVTFPDDDREMRLKSQTFIRKYKQTIEETCRGKYGQQRPCVVLKPKKNLTTYYNHKRKLSSQNDNEENDGSHDGTGENKRSGMSSDMEIETDMSDHDDGENSDQSQHVPLMDPPKRVKLEPSSLSLVSDDIGIEIQTDQRDDRDGSNFTDDFIQTDRDALLPTTSAHLQSYSLRNKRKLKSLKLEIVDSDHNSDAYFSPELNSEGHSSDNDSNVDEYQDEELTPKSTSSKRRKSNSNGNTKRADEDDDNNGSLKCDECDLICSTKTNLWFHRSEDHEDKICVECGMEFNFRGQLSKHMEFHKDPTEWKYECNYCSRKFSEKFNLKKHIIRFHDKNQTRTKSLKKTLSEVKANKVKKFICGICWKRFVNKQVYQTHLYSQAEGKFKCEFCSHVATNVLKLSSHEYQNHCPDEIRERDQPLNESYVKFQWTCPRCQYKSTSCADYQSHFAQTHFKITNAKCGNCKHTDCQSGFKCQKSTKTEYGEILGTSSRFTKTCEICDKSFKTCSRKNSHMRVCHDLSKIADKSKLYNCNVDGCTAYFLVNSQLIHHKVEKHNDTYTKSKFKIKTVKQANIENYQCPKCKKSFQGYTTYRRHVKSGKFCLDDKMTESGEWKCVECDLICSTRKELWRHQNEDHNLIICVECGKIFKKNAFLAAHFVYHKDPKDWELECCKCGKKFGSKPNLKKHMRKVHAVDDAEVFTKNVAKPEEVNTNFKAINLKYRCTKCRVYFRNKQVYHTHLYSQVKGKFQCEFCPHLETNVLKLSTHEYQSHCPDKTKEKDRPTSDGGHESSAKFQPTCPRCKYESSGCADYQFHFAQAHFKFKDPKCVKGQEKVSENKCTKCDKIFGTRFDLIQHVKENHLETTFICQKCGKKFLRCSDLNHHLKKHKDEEN